MINQSAKRIALYARVSTSKCEKCGRRQSDHETLSANPWIGARRFPSGVRWIATGGAKVSRRLQPDRPLHESAAFQLLVLSVRF